MKISIQYLSVLFCIVLVLCSGCFSLYKHRVSGSKFSVYSDENPLEPQQMAEFSERLWRGLSHEFPKHAKNIPAANIVHSRSKLSRQNIFVARRNQEGYYLPLLNLIHLSPDIVESASARRIRNVRPIHDQRQLRVVLIHETAHHFLISAYPQINEMFWLNEGLACILENAQLDADDRLQYPIFHPWLYQTARNALLASLGGQWKKELRKLRQASWSEFHQAKNKTNNYALGYAMAAHLLRQCPDPTLEAKVERILSWGTLELEERLVDLPQSLLPRLHFQLEELLGGPFSEWVCEEWVELGLSYSTAFIEHLILRSQQENSQLTLCTLCKVLAFGTTEQQGTASALVSQALCTSTTSQTVALLKALNSPGQGREIFQSCIELLASSEPNLRVQSAKALARFPESKKTITRPSFWRDASPTTRQQEILEWQHWLGFR